MSFTLENLFSIFFSRKNIFEDKRPELLEFVNNSVIEKKNFNGAVTSLNPDGLGVVGSDILFNLIDFNIFQNCSTELRSLKVNDKVYGEAMRKDPFSSWTVITMFKVTEDWENGLDTETVCENQISGFNDEILDIFIAKVVSKYNEDSFSLSNGISIHQNVANCKFSIMIGDWLQCEKHLEDFKIKPLRSKTVYGSVTFNQPDYFVVNNEVYCHRNLISSRLRIADRVIAEVIESNQLKFNWRALSVSLEHSSNLENSQNILTLSKLTKNFDGLQRNSPRTDLSIHFKLQNSKSALPNIKIVDNLSIELKGVGYLEYLKISIKNISSKLSHNLENVFIKSDTTPQIKLDSAINLPIILDADSTTIILFSCFGKVAGHSDEKIYFKVDKTIFKCDVDINVLSGNYDVKRNTSVRLPNSKGRVIRGEKPIHSSPFIPMKLPYAPIPDLLWKSVLSQDPRTKAAYESDPQNYTNLNERNRNKNKKDIEMLLKYLSNSTSDTSQNIFSTQEYGYCFSNLLENYPILEEPLNLSNYVENFTLLLHLEEIEMNLQLRKYDIERTCFHRHGQYLSLYVEGLSENRPSLMIGDTIQASLPMEMGESNDTAFEGVIHEVLSNKVLLKFNPNFQLSYQGEDYAVSLHFNRTPMRRCHMAVSHAIDQLGSSILFPTELNFQLPQVTFTENENFQNTSDCSKNLNLHTVNYLGEAVSRVDPDNFDGLGKNLEVNNNKLGSETDLSSPRNVMNSEGNHNLDSTKSTKMNNYFIPRAVEIKSIKNNFHNPVSYPNAVRKMSLEELQGPKQIVKTEANFSTNERERKVPRVNRNVALKEFCSSSPKKNDDIKGVGNFSKFEVPFGINVSLNGKYIPYYFKENKNGYCIPVLLKKPTKIRRETPNMKTLTWANSVLNLEQKMAVKMILEGSSRPLPYIIYGPPGTGKTVTLVEALLQIYLMIPHSRILAVSPSNSASDLVALRLLQSNKLKSGELVRLNAYNRKIESVPPELQKFCKYAQDIDDVARHRIIVCTATSAGIFYTTRLKNGHFTNVFVDEAGQLTEAEILVPLGLVNSASGQIVLAGDPKQLGPVVVSKLAKKYGLYKSLLNRLCDSVLYSPHEPEFKEIYKNEKENLLENKNFKKFPNEANKVNAEFSSGENSPKIDRKKVKSTFEPKLVTLLVHNYRSHKDLIVVPSKLFYRSSLVSSSKNPEIYSLLNWPQLPNPEVPLIFHSILGINQQEGDSPSWFNPAEAFQVARYVMNLLNYGLGPPDIGVITPYKKQVEKIRQLLSAFGVESGIKVGTVEDFQGQEKLAIILSTVRSSREFIQSDVIHHLGFVQSAERFNVAVTRSIALLIVVGNPILLSKDPNWSAFITFCLTKNAVKGHLEPIDLE